MRVLTSPTFGEVKMATSRICSIPDCGKPHHSHGYCAAHYSRFVRLGDALAGGISRRKNNGQMCSVQGCKHPSRTRGMCAGHYNRWRRHGDPLAGETRHYHDTCTIPGCTKSHKSFGYCGAHLRRFKLYGDPLGVAPKAEHPLVCIVPGCSRSANGHANMCQAHYKRWWRHGNATAGASFRAGSGEPMRWLLAHVDYDGPECLPWPFARDPSGYAVIGRPKQVASRVMCEMAHGAPPSPQHEAAHNCGRGHEGCVNPSHLRWDTVAGNAADRVLHGTDTRGEKNASHKLTEANVLDIRRLRGVYTQFELADMFGIHQGTISSIQLRRSWAWLD